MHLRCLGISKKELAKKKQPGGPGYSRAFQTAPVLFIQATEADSCAFQQTNQQTLHESFRKSFESGRDTTS